MILDDFLDNILPIICTLFVIFLFVLLFVFLLIEETGEFTYKDLDGEIGNAIMCSSDQGKLSCLKEDGTHIVVKEYRKQK